MRLRQSRLSFSWIDSLQELIQMLPARGGGGGGSNIVVVDGWWLVMVH